MSRFADMLSFLRRREGLSQQDLADRLGLSKSAISMYENDARKPSFEVLEAIADYFNIGMGTLTGTADVSSVVQASPAREIDPIYDALNANGKKELCRYGRYLATSDEYAADDGAAPVLTIKHYLAPAAAGYASPIEGEDYEDIPLPSDAPLGADFCITIQGDSMEPYIMDGSLVYVKRGVPLKEFEPGIFFVDGDVYCKQWCRDYAGTLHLLSANPRRRDANIDISKDSGRNVVCFGKVLLDRKLPAPEYV